MHDEAMEFRKLKGMADILPPESHKWFFLQKKICQYLENSGFSYVETPCLEKTDLFVRSTGKETEVVQKQMYSFLDKNEESITLRPEATAGVVRAYIENKIFGQGGVEKYFYFGSLFRYERPQKGRQRQFFQYGVEILGTADPKSDAEVIQVFSGLYQSLSVKNTLLVNSLGSKESRAAYLEKLREYLKKYEKDLDADSQKRMTANTLRCFDSKNEKTREIMDGAPKILDSISSEDKKEFDEVQNYLARVGVSFEVDPKVVRGLDYYTKTAFEFVSDELGAKDTLCGGGRYDGLVKTLGGPEVPAVGCAAGMERLMLVTGEDQGELNGVFIVSLGEEAEEQSLKIAQALRAEGVKTHLSYDKKSVKSQMRQADKARARYACIVGENELRSGKVMIKDMKESSQEEVAVDKLKDYFKK